MSYLSVFFIGYVLILRISNYWCFADRVGISQIIMAPVESLFMERNLAMRISSWSTLDQVMSLLFCHKNRGLKLILQLLTTHAVIEKFSISVLILTKINKSTLIKKIIKCKICFR